MESVLAAAITGVLTLIGVLISNSRSRAVMEVKLDTLSERVHKHNELISRTYQLDLDVSGMLLYAQTEKDRHIDETWGELGHVFHCRTLDLSREFKDIAAELDAIAAMVL